MESVAVVGAPRAGQPFASILDSDRNVLTIPRRMPPDITKVMQDVSLGEVFEQEAWLEVASPDCSALLRAVQDEQARRYLTRDISELVWAFGAVMHRRLLCVSLAVVADDSCRKLHADDVSIRLLCTYAGPGTEWVADEDVVREHLARTDVDTATANRSVLRQPDAVRHCTPGEVILLKGDAYPGNRGRGAVHRSPPVAGRRLRRLVLKMDERSFQE